MDKYATPKPSSLNILSQLLIEGVPGGDSDSEENEK